MTRGEQEDFITNILSAAMSAASEERAIQVPDEQCLGKLHNIIERLQYLPPIQNLTLSDLSEELTSLSTSHQLSDFSIVQLMLVKSTQSASFEPKFHDNYVAFLEKVDSDSLYAAIVRSTCVICKVILCPAILLHPTLKKSSSGVLLRVIKNLGGWLGKVIVSTKRFLLKTDIDLKSLIVEAYELGLMTKIIPFVLEFLEPFRRSPMYQPSNPWIMTILKLLYEIYMMPNLENSLHLSIEGSLEKFGVLEQLKPTSILQEKHRKMKSNKDFGNDLEKSAKPLNSGRYAKARHDNHRMYSRELFKFLVTIKTPSSFFGSYPELVREMKDVVLEVLEKIGPLLIKHAATVAYETAKACVLISYPHGSTDRSVTKTFFKMAGSEHMKDKAGSLAIKYIQHTGKIFLCGWMSYRVGDLLQQRGVPYALQPAIVEGVIDDNFECIREKLGACAKEKAYEYFSKQAVCIPDFHKSTMGEIRNELGKDVDVDAMSNFLNTVSKSKKEKLAVLCEVICKEFSFQKDPPNVCMYSKKMAYLDPFVKGRNEGMSDLLHALENFCKNSRSVRGLEDFLVHGFLTTGYLSKKVILEWFEEGSRRDENNLALFEYVETFSSKANRRFFRFYINAIHSMVCHQTLLLVTFHFFGRRMVCLLLFVFLTTLCVYMSSLQGTSHVSTEYFICHAIFSIIWIKLV